MSVILLKSPVTAHDMTFANVLALRVSLTNFLLAVICLGLWSGALYMTRLHRSDRNRPVTHPALQITLAVTICTLIFSLAVWLRHPDRITFEGAASFWLLAIVFFFLSRATWKAYNFYLRPHLRRERKVLIVGSGWRAQQAAQKLQNHPQWRYHLIGFVDNELICPGEPLIGGIADLDSILMKQVVDEVIITLPVKSMYAEIQTAITACERAGIQSGYPLDLFTTEITKRRTHEEHHASSVILHMIHNDRGLALKRLLDITGALFGFIVLSPVLVLVAILVKLTSDGPVFFQQERYGLNKRTFSMYKFRSMVVNAEQLQAQLEHLNETTGPVFKIKKDPRVTTIGRFIRTTSLDELPQLLNVLRGEMSLVGPRPLPMRDVNLFSEASLMRRFSVRPGLTGLWQVSGRSNTTFASWVKLDLEYIDRWTILLDMKILAKTLPAVLKRHGAS